MSDHLMPTYARLPINFVKGEAAYLWDTEGKRYLDALGGIAVCALGHSHPEITKAISEQAETLLHTSNLYGIQLQEQLADSLCSLSNMEKTFFCNSGAEANEAAIKIARRFGNERNKNNPSIIVMEGSFHGRTMATLSATGNKKVHQGFEPLVSGFIRVPYNNIAAIEKAMQDNPDVVAVMLEPIQGEGGINILDNGFLTSLRTLCDQHDCLLMLDEIQTGIGRTGEWFAFQHENITPDVVTLAKALGNGVPIGACLAKGKAAAMLQPGSHGTTFGGNLLATRTAHTVISVIEKNQYVKRNQILGELLLNGFQNKLANVAGVKSIRGKGLMLGIELEKDCGDLVMLAIEQGILINVTAGNVVRLLPPFILTDAQAQEIVDCVSELILIFLTNY